MKQILEDGRVVEIVPLSAKVPTKRLLEYINGIIEEDGYLQYDEKFSMAQQEDWKKNTLRGVKMGEQIYLAALYGGKVVGSCSAKREVGRGRRNVVVGIAISEGFRGAGLGEFLMRETIGRVKREFGPDKIYLYVAGANKAAISLYEKLGFEKFVRYPGWWVCGGKRTDIFGMMLKGARKKIEGGEG